MTPNKMTWRIKAGLIVALCLAGIKFGLVPLYKWQDETIQKIGVIQKTVAQKKALIVNENRIDNLLRNAKAAFEEALEFYYQDFSDVQALQLELQKEMERLSVTCGIKILSTDWLYPSEGEIVQAPIKIKCSAAPEKLMAFISAVENGKRFLSVDRIKLLSGRKSSTVHAEFDISAYGTRGDDV